LNRAVSKCDSVLLASCTNLIKSDCRSRVCGEFDFTGFPSFSSGFSRLWCQNGATRNKSTLLRKLSLKRPRLTSAGSQGPVIYSRGMFLLVARFRVQSVIGCATFVHFQPAGHHRGITSGIHTANLRSLSVQVAPKCKHLDRTEPN